MQEEIRKLNQLGDTYIFEYAGVADYVTVKRAGRGVATIRMTSAGVIGFLGEEIAQVMSFLKQEGVKLA